MKTRDLRETVDEFSKKFNTDVYLFSAEVETKNADIFIEIIRSVKDRRENCSLILTTNGGDPDDGYRIVRTIKRYYPKGKLILYVLGICKSTGTLMALGADEIVMSDFSQLGPLDVQLAKEDELFHTSSLNYMQGLNSLKDNIFTSFETNFLNIKFKSGQSITTKTAAEISSNLAIGLISPISAQIDPVKLGEVNRAINIAYEYGLRLTTNIDLINHLITEYPSHSFVIDFKEAKEIFDNVRWINSDEYFMENSFQELVRKEKKDCVIFLNDLGGPKEEKVKKESNGSDSTNSKKEEPRKNGKNGNKEGNKTKAS